MSISVMRTPCAAVLLAAGLLAAVGSPARADSIKLFTGSNSGYPSGDAYKTSAAFVAMPSGTTCPNSDSTCTAPHDTVAATEVFAAAGGLTITATATGSGTAQVWGDFMPTYGGLGVKGSSSDGEDQINGSDILTLKFSAPVTLIGVLTLVDGQHTPFGPGNPSLATSTALFTGGAQFLLNGVLTTFNSANADSLSITSDTFTFAANANDNPFFYVSGLVWNPATTPLPAALPLFATGLGAVGGLIGWRKKKAAALGA